MTFFRMLNPNDADDSDSCSSSADEEKCMVVVPRPKRSATVSPSTRNTVGMRRRQSDANLNFFNERERQRERRRSMVRASRERSESRRMSQQNLRKTNSEPNVDMIDVETLQRLLLSLPKFAASRSRLQHRHDSDSGGEMTTEIEELKDAAKSIQSLQRVLAYPSQHSSDRGVYSDVESLATSATTTTTDLAPTTLNNNSIPEGVGRLRRASGISTTSRLGHPRGVMQFMRADSTEMAAVTTTRKTSVPDGFGGVAAATLAAATASSSAGEDCATFSRARRRGIVDDDDAVDRPSETLAGVSRFSKLLDSFRARPTSPEQPSISWSPYVYSDGAETALESCGGMEDSLHEADILLWKKRSRASLRRHYSVRQLAARELIDTEKSFVEGLEFLVTKYMRPLRQPLECTLIEASLVDKIFYRVPEILAHHQVLLAALTQRLEQWHKDTVIGDVLLAHFSKQSMIETFIAFVDNFKFAKAAISQARQKHAFEKYYNRCCRDHCNKLDLDALLISPIQRVPRYELIVKQMLKHTPVEHEDRERLIRAQRHIHCLAVAINQHKEGSEQMEQRLREIEAIVDGLDDLVSSDRTLLRHDIINIKGTERERCIFMLSDMLLVTSVRKTQKSSSSSAKISSHPMDFLDNNRFKLLFKIALDDVQIAKDTLSQLEQVEQTLETSREDDRVLKKMMQLSSLLKCDKKMLMEMLDTMETGNSMRIRELTEKMSNDPELSAVNLDVLTSNGYEPIRLEFANAEKRSVWEATLKDAKISLLKHQTTPVVAEPKHIIAHQTRPGLQLCTATVVPGKRPDSLPSVWVCASDKFSGQVAVINLDAGSVAGGDAIIENSATIGNAAVTAMCTVPPTQKPRKRKFKSQRSGERTSGSGGIEWRSSGSESDATSDEATSSGGQTTVWIGNDDGEVFVVNSTERVRTRARERLARLHNSVTAICAANGNVYVATYYSTQVQLLMFKPAADGTWDLVNPISIAHICHNPITAMVEVGRRVVLASGNALYGFHTDFTGWQTPSEVIPSSDSISVLTLHGGLLYVAGRKSTICHVVDVFTLKIINHFNISPFVRQLLSGKEDIIREHKMGCLRITCLTTARDHLWIGTSAGYVLNVSLHAAKSQPTPDFSVCDVGHSGPCRIVLPVVSSSQTLFRSNQKKMSTMTQPSQHNSQLMILSCGEGLDNTTSTQDPKTDAVNHLIFWKCV